MFVLLFRNQYYQADMIFDRIRFIVVVIVVVLECSILERNNIDLDSMQIKNILQKQQINTALLIFVIAKWIKSIK